MTNVVIVDVAVVTDVVVNVIIFMMRSPHVVNNKVVTDIVADVIDFNAEVSSVCC